MKKAIARNIDTNHIPIEKLNALLETFALKHSVVRHINLGSIRHFKLVENNIKQFTQHINLCFFCALF